MTDLCGQYSHERGFPDGGGAEGKQVSVWITLNKPISNILTLANLCQP